MSVHSAPGDKRLVYKTVPVGCMRPVLVKNIFFASSFSFPSFWSKSLPSVWRLEKGSKEQDQNLTQVLFVSGPERKEVGFGLFGAVVQVHLCHRSD